MTLTAQIVVPAENGFDFDALLRANMERVFNERDPQRRMAALEGLWSAGPVPYERDEAFAGTQVISGSTEALHALLPPGTVAADRFRDRPPRCRRPQMEGGPAHRPCRGDRHRRRLCGEWPDRPSLRLPRSPAGLNVPTLVIHGDDDQIVPIGHAGALTAKIVPNAEFKVYEGAPHGLASTYQDRLNADLLAFARA